MDRRMRRNTDSETTWRSRTSDWHPTQVGRTLDLFMAHLGAPRVEVVASLGDRWGEIVGPALADRTRPIEIIDGVLTVGCDEGPWASQMAWMDRQVKDRCCEIFVDLTIDRVRLQVRHASI